MPRLAYERWNNEHRQHVAAYLAEVDELYQLAADEMVQLGMSYGYDPSSGRPFSYASSKLGKQSALQSLTAFHDKLLGIITAGATSEWAFANAKTDSWVMKLFSSPKDGCMLHNLKALEAYLGRKVYGHTLSARVWDNAKQYQQNIEMGLSVGISEGRSAAQISRDIRAFLLNPDALFRRVRDEYGNLVLSRFARVYHPGQGVYRSAYQNALRMARTEINGAYRESDFTRWNQLDFIVGVEVKTSKTHADWLSKFWNPRFKKGYVPEEICDTMAGKYPKDFKFIGWHPNCKCYAVPIIANEGTGKDWWEDEPENVITSLPTKAQKWIDDNSDRIEKAAQRGKLPYWIAENKGYTTKI